MLAKEINHILKDKTMANKETNLKIIEDDNKPPRLTLAKFYKEFQEFAKQQQKFNDKVANFMINQQKFNEYVVELFKKHGWLD